MKRIITDEELVQYVSGSMSPKEERRIEMYAMENGETDMLLSAIIANHESNVEYANYLLGTEEEMFLVPSSKNESKPPTIRTAASIIKNKKNE